jgi:hypothetical protein
MTDIELVNLLPIWLKNHFKDSELLIERDVCLDLGDESPRFRIDLIAVQSKSNVIHAFEIKSKINNELLNSIIWQIDSLYSNYKWLVISQEFKSDDLTKQLKAKGLGLLIYKPHEKTFHVEAQPNYIDGNLINYYPTINEKWLNKVSHGSNFRSKKKN